MSKEKSRTSLCALKCFRWSLAMKNSSEQMTNHIWEDGDHQSWEKTSFPNSSGMSLWVTDEGIVLGSLGWRFILNPHEFQGILSNVHNSQTYLEWSRDKNLKLARWFSFFPTWKGGYLWWAWRMYRCSISGGIKMDVKKKRSYGKSACDPSPYPCLRAWFLPVPHMALFQNVGYSNIAFLANWVQ